MKERKQKSIGKTKEEKKMKMRKHTETKLKKKKRCICNEPVKVFKTKVCPFPIIVLIFTSEISL